MTAAPRIQAIVLNWNQPEATLACLASIRGDPDPAISLLVIDNGSEDDSVARMRPSLGAGELLTLPNNLGFAAACNIGINRAISSGQDYVWLVNNDVEVMHGCLQALVATAERDPSLGAVGAVLYYDPSRSSVEAWGGGTVSGCLGRSDHYRRPGYRQPDYLVGACLLLRCRAIAQVGIFDERFFLYWEDTDLCRRLTEAGWKLAVTPDGCAVHRGSQSLRALPERLDFLYNASAARFFRKHYRWPLVPIVVGGLTRSLKRLLHGELPRAAAVWRGLWAGTREAGASRSKPYPAEPTRIDR